MSLAPKCPRCGAAVTAQADDLGFLNCEGCGTRLRKAPTIKLTIQSPTPTSGSAPVPAAAVPPLAHAGNRDTDATDSLLARIERVDASATLPPGLKSNLVLKAAGYAPPPVPASPAVPVLPPSSSNPTATVPPSALPPPAAAAAGLLTLMQSIQRDLTALMQRHQELSEAVNRLAAVKPVPAAVPVPPVQAEAPPAKPAAGAHRSVLIVEDDVDLAERIRLACTSLGLDPVVVTEAGAALAALGRERPALVIVEPLLPGDPSGLDLVNQVKATIEWLAIPILVHTSAAIANHEQARNDFGADDYVLKSADSVETLTRKVARLIA